MTIEVAQRRSRVQKIASGNPTGYGLIVSVRLADSVDGMNGFEEKMKSTGRVIVLLRVLMSCLLGHLDACDSLKSL